MIRLQRSAVPRRGFAPSPVMAYMIPWASVAAGSIVPGWLVIAAAPVLPPFGYLLLLGWRQLRPGLLPAWAGLPLGLVDDLASGHPPGTAMLLWSASMLALDAIEARFPWRSFRIEWGVAAGFIAAYLALGAGIDRLAGGGDPLLALPQLVLAALAYPVVARVVARFDRMRLVRYRVYR